MNKRDDARKLKPAAQHMLRRQVVNAVRDGMKQVEAANLFSASLRAVNKWVALDKLGGLRALKAKRRGRRTGEGALNDRQAARIYQLILGKMPDQLKLPFIYVRPKPKEHGLANQIEGVFEAVQKTVIIEDLISTGKSSLQVVDVLRNAGLDVIGMVSIFNYGFDVAEKAFAEKNCTYISLTNYNALISLALDKGIVAAGMEQVLLQWRNDPANWQGVIKESEGG